MNRRGKYPPHHKAERGASKSPLLLIMGALVTWLCAGGCSNQDWCKKQVTECEAACTKTIRDKVDADRASNSVLKEKLDDASAKAESICKTSCADQLPKEPAFAAKCK